jgi:carbamoyl-phosphate synthase large subunit
MNILFSCIGRRGYIADYFRAHLKSSDKIIGTSNSEWTEGFSSCDVSVIMPDIASPSYINSLLNLCDEYRIDGILSFYDPDINVLSSHLKDFRSIGVTPILPSKEVNDICFDKFKTSQFLESNGFATPQTYLSYEKALEALESGSLTFPVIVKPRYGFASANVFKARNYRELEVFFNCEDNMIIQELIHQEGYDFDLCCDLNGKVLSIVPWRKICSRAGETDQSETCDSPEIMEEALRLGSELGMRGHVGPLDADVFLRDGRVVFLEMNPRFGGGYPVTQLAGADFPKLVIEIIRGGAPEPEIGKYRIGTVMLKRYAITGGDKNGYLLNGLNGSLLINKKEMYVQ